MSIQAINDYVFLTYDKKQDTKKGIILSDVSKDKPVVMRVVSVGPDAKNLKTGDKVVIDPFLPREIKVDNQTLFILKSKEIFGILK
jgi:co-chaperonin GroES (HSP10)